LVFVCGGVGALPPPPQYMAVNIRCLLTVHKVDDGTLFLQLTDMRHIYHTLRSLYSGMVYCKQAYGSDWQHLSDKMIYLWSLTWDIG